MAFSIVSKTIKYISVRKKESDAKKLHKNETNESEETFPKPVCLKYSSAV